MRQTGYGSTPAPHQEQAPNKGWCALRAIRLLGGGGTNRLLLTTSQHKHLEGGWLEMVISCARRLVASYTKQMALSSFGKHLLLHARQRAASNPYPSIIHEKWAQVLFETGFRNDPRFS